MLCDLFCIPLALRTLALPKLGFGSGIKTNALRFVLYSARLALTLSQKQAGIENAETKNQKTIYTDERNTDGV